MLRDKIKKIKILIEPYRFIKRKISLPLKIYFYNKKKISEILKQDNIKLELGSREKKPGWTVIDLAEGADLRLGLTKPLSFPDNSITEIHSEHFFEHLTIEEIKFCLNECFRILKKGGEISFSVPDFERACHLYCEEKEFSTKRFWMLPNPNWCKSKMDELNFLIYANGYHNFMFDRENGIKRLEEAGFKNCRVRKHEPAKDNERRKEQSIYFIGEKSNE